MRPILLPLLLAALACDPKPADSGPEGDTDTDVDADTDTEGVFATTHVILGWNDQGMHALDQDVSQMMISPPGNTLHAQVMVRGAVPEVLDSGVALAFSIPGNTTSADKTSFWEHAEALLGVRLEPGAGLTGNALSGSLVPTGAGDWVATAVPITPLLDDGTWDPYPLSAVTVTAGGTAVAGTRVVLPVSWEIRCDLCHGSEPATALLGSHDRLHGTGLAEATPVLCGACHAQAALDLPGQEGVPSLSHAMHGAHAGRMAMTDVEPSCYACHPGPETQALRDLHSMGGKTCTDCHGGIEAVADVARRPWVDLPRCEDCHVEPGKEFGQVGLRYGEARGHGGVACGACHGPPHALAPSTQWDDNVQADGIQGYRGPLQECEVCHLEEPDAPFLHRRDAADR